MFASLLSVAVIVQNLELAEQADFKIGRDVAGTNIIHKKGPEPVVPKACNISVTYTVQFVDMGVAHRPRAWLSGLYRVYYARAGQRLLLIGGDKRRQHADIETAVGYWRDWQRRNRA